MAGVPRESTYFQAQPNDRNEEDPQLFWMPTDRFAPQYDQARKHLGGPLIYCFGGSIVGGFQADHPFAEVLEALLRATERGRGADVVKWGANGYTSYQARVLAERAVKARRPDIIVECNGWNDHENADYSDHEMAVRNRDAGKRILYELNKSRAFGWFRRRLLPAAQEDFSKRPANQRYRVRVKPQEFHVEMERFLALAKFADSRIIFLTQASPVQSMADTLDPYFQIMKGVAERDPNARVVDVRPAFVKAISEKRGTDGLGDTLGKKNSYILDLCHPTDKGHRMIAEMLLPVVQELLIRR